MSASSARREHPDATRTGGRRAGMLALAVGLGVLACVVLLGSGAAWAHPAGMASAGASGVATATTAAHTPTAAATPTIAPTPTPVTLTSNGLAIFTTLGCIIGVIGLLAFGIAWITLLSDGWGSMLKALIMGNRRGKMRFARKANNARGRQPDAWDRRGPSARDRAGWR